MIFERICEAKLDERLARDADSLGFLVDGLKQVDREVHVHTPDFTPWTAGPREVQVNGQVSTRVVQAVDQIEAAAQIAGVARSAFPRCAPLSRPCAAKLTRAYTFWPRKRG